MSRRNNLGLAEVVAEKMEDLDLLGEYTMYEFLGKTLIAFEQGDTHFINSEILEPLYNIDEKTDFEREIIYDVEDRLPINEEQQTVRELISHLTGQDPILFLRQSAKSLEEFADNTNIRAIAILLEGMYDFINTHQCIEFINGRYVEV